MEHYAVTKKNVATQYVVIWKDIQDMDLPLQNLTRTPLFQLVIIKILTLKNTCYGKFPFSLFFFLKNLFTTLLCFLFPKGLNNLCFRHPFPQYYWDLIEMI